MDVWGYRIFENDGAMIARDKVIQGLEEHLYELVNDHEGDESTEDEQFALMVMLTALVKACDGYILTFTREEILAWKAVFLKIYDEAALECPIGDEDEDEPYMSNHRAVIVTTFDAFADVCMPQKELDSLIASVEDKPERKRRTRKTYRKRYAHR